MSKGMKYFVGFAISLCFSLGVALGLVAGNGMWGPYAWARLACWLGGLFFLQWGIRRLLKSDRPSQKNLHPQYNASVDAPIIHFYRKDGQLHILYHCDICNSDLDVTALVDRLCDYVLDNCPDQLYQAWKILRLGSPEYRQGDMEHSILKSAKEATE